MIDFHNQIEAELIDLFRQKQTKIVFSERDKPVSNIIFEKYYSGTVENQLSFKEIVDKLIFKYSTVNGEIADFILYHLLYISLKVKIPIDNLLTDILRNKSLANRHYEDRNLTLLVLKGLIDIPITYRTEKELIRLMREDPFYNLEIFYCLHFLEIFGRKVVPEGITQSLDSLLNIKIVESEVRLIASQLKSTFRVVSPDIFRNWYDYQIANPIKIEGNLLNKVLLRFVEISETKADFTDWREIFTLINTYSNIYISTDVSSNNARSANGITANGVMVFAMAAGKNGGIEQNG